MEKKNAALPVVNLHAFGIDTGSLLQLYLVINDNRTIIRFKAIQMMSIRWLLKLKSVIMLNKLSCMPNLL